MEGMPRLPMLAPEAKIPVNQFDDEFSLKIKEVSYYLYANYFFQNFGIIIFLL
uniref:Uncharacterized protein n=1 Tax=Heterorhabditis bacteriophora TaxID=37862 RepID=A0A1I7W8A3_HETBA